MTTQIINNLRRAIEIFEAFPEDRLNLSRWAYNPGKNFTPQIKEHNCGTLFCGAGLLSVTEDFRVQLREIFGPGIFDGWAFCGLANAMSKRDEMFGEHPFKRLFEHYGEGYWDSEILDGDYNPISHKALLIERFRRQLVIYESKP